MPRPTAREPLAALPVCICFLFLMVTCAIAPAVFADGRPGAATNDGTAMAQRLRAQIQAYLKDGRIEAAIRAAQSALRDAPEDAAIRREFVDLHISVARSWLAEERFGDAETALAAVLRVQPGQPDAAQLVAAIASARQSIPDRLRQARSWIELEWYEPAFTAFRQAIALDPKRRSQWVRDYRRAAIGAGDDAYLTKNFHQAFYYYDAAIELGEKMEVSPNALMVSRWMQSLIHALFDDSRIRYPAEYWRLIFDRIADANYRGEDAAILKETLEGLAFEHAGDDERAAQSYARVAGARSRHGSMRPAALKRLAIERVRGLYSQASTGRRSGEWQRRDSETEQLLESPRFRVHHHNAVIAQLVDRSLNFHFERLADAWALDVDEIPWRTKADIHLHANDDAFRKATGQAPPITAISHIQMQGSAIRKKVIHVHLTDEMLLSASLAHELAHLMVAELRRDRPLPAAVAEGIALHAEPQCRHRQFARLFEGLRRPTPIRRLLTFEEVHPTNAAFYSEAHRLVAVLRSRAPLADIVMMRGDPIDAKLIARACGFGNRRQLQRLYNQVAPTTPGEGLPDHHGSTN